MTEEKALAAIMAARQAMIRRGIRPTRLEVSADFPPTRLGAMIYGLQVVSGEETAVLGRPRHGIYECVPWEREPVKIPNI